jgi:excisionase family DNA binding protein
MPRIVGVATYGDDMPRRRLLSSGQAADELGFNRSTLWRAVKSGDITPTETTPGGHFRFDLDDLRRQIREVTARRRAESDE